MATFTEEMRDFLLMKSHYLYRLENGTIQQLVKPYNQAKKQLVEQLRDLEDRLTNLPVRTRVFINTQRLEILNSKIAEIDYVLQIASLESASELNNIRQSLVSIEYEDYVKKFKSRFNKIGVSINEVPYEQLNWIMNNSMLAESTGSEFIGVTNQAVNVIRAELSQSIILGEDMALASKRLFGLGDLLKGEVGDNIRNRARMIARTEIMAASNRVSRSIYNSNQDILKGIMYTGTLDIRTCMVCAPLDGTVYKYINGITSAPIVPQHPFCRCTYSPVTYSWSELQKRAGVKITNKSNRDYFSGKVDEPIMTYARWFNKLSEKQQIKIMGKTRFNAWKNGKFKLGKEMLAQTQSYTLEQYKKSLIDINKNFDI